MSKQSKLFQNSESFERATLDLHGENHKSFYYKDLWFSPKADFKSNRLLKSAQSILNFFAVVEIRTKLVSVTTLAVALLYVWWRAGFPRVAPLVLMWAATLLLIWERQPLTIILIICMEPTAIAMSMNRTRWLLVAM